ncbi:hypothetical protein, partial [Thiolapillus sp.]|uniref:hypothetical protein n=1 Tax=Thiolapillus sp. TaxID=2017437 RepID=UPI003AF5EAAF
MFSLWRKARRENSAASRLLGSTSLRFALHGWQRENGFFHQIPARVSPVCRASGNGDSRPPGCNGKPLPNTVDE